MSWPCVIPCYDETGWRADWGCYCGRCRMSSAEQLEENCSVPNCSPSTQSRRLWRRTGNFLYNFLQFYVYGLRLKAGGLTTFLIEFWTLKNDKNLEHSRGLNSLLPFGALSEVDLGQLRAPSHYLTQCWLTISKVLWCSPEGDVAGNLKIIILNLITQGP